MVAAIASSRSFSVSTVSLSAISSARSRTSCCDIGFAEHRRRFAHRNRARAEALDAEAEAGQRFGMQGEPLGIVFRQVDDLGHKQHLRRHGRECSAFFSAS